MTLSTAGKLQWPSPTAGTYPITIRAQVMSDTLFADQKFTLVIESDTTADVSEDVEAFTSYRIYPVPAGNSITLEFAQPLRRELAASLSDATGCRVHDRLISVGTTTYTFDTSALSQGMFVLMLEDTQATHYVPVLIRR